MQMGKVLTRQRLSAAFEILMVWMLVWAGAVLVSIALDAMDPQNPGETRFGGDYSAFHSAGLLTQRGDPAGAYDPARHRPINLELRPDIEDDKLPWRYPPPALAVAAALAHLQMEIGLLLFLGLGIVLFGAALRRAGFGWRALVVGFGFPGSILVLTFGQTGFLTAAALVAGFAAMIRGQAQPAQQWWAGLWLGLLAFKPHLAVLVPMAVLAMGQWRTVLAGLGTMAVLYLVSYLAYGPDPWLGFMAEMGKTHEILLSFDENIYLLTSSYGALRLAGAAFEMALGGQILATLFAMVITAWVWWQVRCRQVPPLLALALCCAATPLALPYTFTYDMPVMVPGIVLLWRAGDWRSRLAVSYCWLSPTLHVLLAEESGIAFGVLGLWLLVLMLLRAAWTARKNHLAHLPAAA